MVGAFDGGWLRVKLAGPSVRIQSVTIEGRDVAVDHQQDGTWLTLEVERPVQVVMRAEVQGALAQGVALQLAPAAQGVVAVQGQRRAEARTEDEQGTIRMDDRHFWTGAERLQVSLTDTRAKANKQTLAVGHSALGLTVGEAELRVRNKIQ